MKSTEESQKTELKPTVRNLWNSPGMKERKAYILLVVIAVGLSWLLFSASIAANDHKFCQLIHLGTENPVPKPAHPKEDPSRQHAYDGYVSAVKLGHDLGCGK